MVQKLGLNFNKSNFNELKIRILFLLFAVIIFRLGSFIPIPGINAILLSKILFQNHGTILDALNIFSGGALNRVSIFALGVVPYISASIIIQLLSLVVPFFKEIKKDGDSGRVKINEYIRYTTVFFAFFQALLLSFSLPHFLSSYHLVLHPIHYYCFISTISLVTGTVFLMWLAELITEKGIGNGISIFIFIGVVSTLPAIIINTCMQVILGQISLYVFFLILFFFLFLIYLVVYVECSYRQVPIFYARRQYTNRIYSNQSSYLPIKLNISGVIPAIFTSSILVFPATLCSWFDIYAILNKYYFLNNIFIYIRSSNIIYFSVYIFLIIFFCYFYNFLIFNIKDTADNLKKSSAFIPGIRPGLNTEHYIEKILLRVTLIGALYISFICLTPDFLKFFLKIPFSFSGTSLLIIVVVIIDFISQVQTLLLTSKYKNVLKKSNLYFNKKNY
ncbi:preprotein translocase subunit SecY [Buchnera aphidicola (Mollitrichosiphum nigrofasciatum)]|uniref:preprotein translocase subunit SecY n=1 Tax=Buchnera aphidicola TaxID=9 RepID=UPI0031B87765